MLLEPKTSAAPMHLRSFGDLTRLRQIALSRSQLARYHSSARSLIVVSSSGKRLSSSSKGLRRSTRHSHRLIAIMSQRCKAPITNSSAPMLPPSLTFSSRIVSEIGSASSGEDGVSRPRTRTLGVVINSLRLVERPPNDSARSTSSSNLRRAEGLSLLLLLMKSPSKSPRLLRSVTKDPRRVKLNGLLAGWVASLSSAS